MQCVDVVHALTSENLDFQPEMGEFGIPRPWNFPKGSGVSMIEDLRGGFSIDILLWLFPGADERRTRSPRPRAESPLILV